jgi:hypothetical protein
MKKILSYSLVLMSIIIFLSTCSNPEEIIPPTGVGGDTTITTEERMAVFEACKKKSAELNNLEGLEDRITFLSWLGTQTAFYSVGFAGEDLYAVFVDGRIVLFVNTPLGDSIGGRVATGGRSRRNRSNNSSGRTEDIPKSKKVSLFKGLGTYFTNNPEILKGIFAEADAGYQVELKEASITNLKSVSGDAVFYIYTHGGAGNLHTKNGPRSIMALWTTDLVTAGTEVTYKTELDEERMCYMFATHNTAATELHYAITSSFVREHMSFAENTLIYLDACNGFNETVTGNVAFRERMIAQAINGKATFVGWTGVTYDGTTTLASQFVFDRLLGANSGGNISQEDPNQRPFDLAPVFADMGTEGFGVAPNGVKLAYKTTVEPEVLLRPTIETMDIDEFSSTLTIKGLFGWDEGRVTVNEVAAAIVEWTPYEIACVIPETGDGSVGDVVVSSPEGIKSNIVPLTEYIIKLNYSSDDNGVKFSGVCDLRLRADVHLRRSKIGETPTKPTYFDLSPVSGRIFNVKGSSATYNVTGRKYDACNLTGCNVQFTESPTHKSGRIEYSRLQAAAQKIPLFAFYNWAPEMKTIKLNFITINVSDIPDVVEERVKCPDKGEAVIPVEQAYGAWFGFPLNNSGGSINFEVAENFNIRPGNWDTSIARSWSLCNTVGSFKQYVSWDVIVPKHAPTDETGARIADTGN